MVPLNNKKLSQSLYYISFDSVSIQQLQRRH